jgi:hypothetical protein
MGSKRDRLSIYDRHGLAVLDFGPMEIWDGADLSLIRESLVRLIVAEKRRGIAFAMDNVKYIPSGFFGMLCDWHERGIRVELFTPQPHVARMRWFQQYFEPLGDDRYRLCSESRLPIGPPDDATEAEHDWDEEAMAVEVADCGPICDAESLRLATAIPK